MNGSEDKVVARLGPIQSEPPLYQRNRHHLAVSIKWQSLVKKRMPRRVLIQNLAML